MSKGVVMGDGPSPAPSARSAGVAVACLVVVWTCAACGLGSGSGRLRTGSTPPSSAPAVYSSSLDWDGGGDDATATTGSATTPTASTPAPQAAAPVTSPPCADPAATAIPEEIEGYTLTPDDSAAMRLLALPPGMQGSRLVHVGRSDGAVADLVSLTGAGYAFGNLSDTEVLDRLARSAGVSAPPSSVAVGGHAGVVVRTSSTATLYAWMPCRNAILAVIGPDSAMAADIAARVSR